MTVILHTDTALYTAFLVQPREIPTAGFFPFKEEETGSEGWEGGLSRGRSGARALAILASLQVSPRRCTASGVMQGHGVIAVQAPGCCHVAPRALPSTVWPKGASGTEDLPQGALKMPWPPEKLIKPWVAINSAEERAR